MTFTLYPAIDLHAGKCVRLSEGELDTATFYNDDPAAQAEAFAAAGATALHVVDLDGAFAGGSVNGAAVERIVAAFPGRVQLGGGIRSRATLDAWIARGVARIVLGTAALADPNLVVQSAKAHPGRIVVAVDARGGMVTTRGWAETSRVPVAELAKRFEGAGVAALLYTDVGRDGMMTGVNLEATLALAQAVRIPVLASGGVAGLDDIVSLRAHAGDGIEGVIVGRALYDGRLDLAQALAAA
ncbi:1-(5-phosphoribosyl)-5-[(5-phosphoribosylamino)methylideneamino]imidazole-4-carboxamide isomerase [Glacieibacterium frigidum]|uniref:1-(5-phosphoribosyl)-5-[(5-phosphoribosylamino)methylideneamino] imidazole-4-carboxamide isomerase n=1 Tax=Glacieibacterium frigidum TaxID=2593303 RepID=A0A552UEK6_9SPHN|nr:1-(5-phosphoribosyl)-5-[(5-phosphoribosylamino)methylideneamino]imidazole-4-carboxamide isomerase [Glacieibacterium frigidum]TRW16666.1 1-(5-phosphoribosyl)-5-[(5-phosphoribosylamino)methylideneamino]imidazole-4-carboxamide isomerase [Glacieibacterium frigidum]